jgi:hypothetical protein
MSVFKSKAKLIPKQEVQSVYSVLPYSFQAILFLRLSTEKCSLSKHLEANSSRKQKKFKLTYVFRTFSFRNPRFGSRTSPVVLRN